MAYKTRTIQPTKKGQKPIRFKEGALTAQAKARGTTIAKLCAHPPTGLIARRCAFKKNVLTGRRR